MAALSSSTSLLINLFILIILALITSSSSSSSSIFITLFLFSSLILFSLNYWLIPGGFAWRNYHHHDTTSCLRGPKGWPILGTLPQMASSLAHKNLTFLAASLNARRLMSFSLGFTRVIISSHPETAREILCNPSFSDRPMKQSARLLMFERAIGFAPSGEYWRHLRKLAASHMFSPRRVAGTEGMRRRVAEEMAARVEEEMVKRGVVEVRGILREGSLSNIVGSVFGSCVSWEEREELGNMVEEGYELIGKFSWEDFLPFMGVLDLGSVKRRCYKLAAKVNGVVGQIVKKQQQQPKGDDIDYDHDHDDSVLFGQNHNNDFLTALLRLPKEERLGDSDMVAILWEMMFRGTDTVAILLEWIIARMVLHQDIQEKARTEIDTCVGEPGHVRDSDIPNLPYLQAIVKEALRLHPPGPLLSWARLAVHDVHVDKQFVPAGTTAMVNMWAITHDASIWKDPWAFRPERFMEDDVSVMGSDLRLAPFGAGRRVCPGRALALATVHLWLAKLLHHFVWLPSALDEPVDLSECLRLSLEMEKPLTCQVIRRL